MTINFNEAVCQTISNKKIFGLRDDAPPAKIDEQEGKYWIAVVNNENRHTVTFTAIDNCIDIYKADGKMDKRCDGMLTYGQTVIFVELKERNPLSGAEWVKDGEKQLRITINHFEKNGEGKRYRVKKAYLANSQRPKFNVGQMNRMDKFSKETGYVLRIINRIDID